MGPQTTGQWLIVTILTIYGVWMGYHKGEEVVYSAHASLYLLLLSLLFHLPSLAGVYIISYGIDHQYRY